MNLKRRLNFFKLAKCVGCTTPATGRITDRSSGMDIGLYLGVFGIGEEDDVSIVCSNGIVMVLYRYTEHIRHMRWRLI